MDSHTKKVAQWINNGIRLENAKQFHGAEESYTRAIHILKSVLRDTPLSFNDHQTVMKYMSDVAKRIQKLRAINKKCATQSMGLTDPRPNETLNPQVTRTSVIPMATAQPASTRSQQLDNDSLNSIGASEFKHAVTDMDKVPGLTSVSPTPLASLYQRNTKGLSDTSSRHTDPMLNANSSGLDSTTSNPISTPMHTKDSEPKLPAGKKSTDASPQNKIKDDKAPPVRSHPSIHFTPRASELVLKAIEIAAKLCKQDELKRAVDVLQHAYDIAQHERKKPDNFKDIETVLKEMRQRYYERYPPRFLQDNPVLPDEMTVLRRSGVTTTIRLPSWDDLTEGYGAENIFMPCDGVWQDRFTPELSQSQKKCGAQLVHLGNLYPKGADLAIVRQADPLSVTQTVVGDCSMVCSLIICASYQKRYPKAKIISNVIYPQDQSGNPIFNPKGKYAVKMLINGMTRLVTIDDRLPANPYTKDLLCTYSRDRSELWVSLMEKAFVKVCGGSYEFPGSTSASDLYKLCGWLPDFLDIGAKDFDAELQWKRLLHSFTIGAVLITLTTPNSLSSQVEREMKLSPGHAYAVLDICEVNSVRVVQLRNPWSCFTWKGALSFEDESNLAVEIHKSLDYNKEMADIGVFWMKWEDVIRYFDSASLSWNPYMLYRTVKGLSSKPTRLACHGTYTYTTSTAEMPQIHICVVKAPKPTRMHLVLSRHITEVAEFSKRFDDDQRQHSLFMALKVYNITSYPSVAQCIGGRCVFGMCYCRRLSSSSDVSIYLEPLSKPVYRDSLAHTMSFDCPAGTTHMVLVVALQLSARKEPFNFTVTLHAQLPQLQLSKESPNGISSKDNAHRWECVGLREEGAYASGVFMHWIPKTCLKYTASVKGAWVKGSTCGGRSEMTTFVYNPQYTLKLNKPALFSVRLSVSECEESCGICLVRRRSCSSSEKPLTSFSSRVGNLTREVDLVVKSKLYGIGGAVIDSALPRTLSYDPHKLFTKTATKQSITLQVEIEFPYNYQHENFSIPNVDGNDQVSVIFIHAIKNGFTLYPSISRVRLKNKDVDHRCLLKDILAPDQGPGFIESDSDTKTLTTKVLIRVNENIENICRIKLMDCPEGEFKNIVSDIIHDSPEVATHLPFLEEICEGISPLHFRRSELKGVCIFLKNYIKDLVLKRQKELGDSPCLSPLPAGEYTLIPSLWKKGVPAAFTIIVEATEPVSMEPIPPEGDGLIEYRVSGRLLSSGKAFTTLFEVPTRLFANNDYFQNNTVGLSLELRGVFTCRLLLLEKAENVENDAEAAFSTTPPSANLSLFTPHGEQELDLVSSSGPYNSLGIAIPPIMLEAKTNYRLVISSSKPSTCKYILRIYTSVPCTTILPEK